MINVEQKIQEKLKAIDERFEYRVNKCFVDKYSFNIYLDNECLYRNGRVRVAQIYITDERIEKCESFISDYKVFVSKLNQYNNLYKQCQNGIFE